MTDVADLLRSALSDHYAIEREIGAGGMATVYLARDLKHERQVAVKVLRPELAAVLGAERFVQEIKTTANLQHPHILPLFDSGEADGFLYYVMPFIDGETLRDKLNRETQLGIEEAVKITTEVADALDYAHRHNVIHRDIKPENILLHDGRPMVADFGIALAVSAAAGGRMTETGLSLGTPHYMSPEQATAEKDLTNRSDIYSLGAVLYEMLTGDPPHVGSSAQQIIMKIVTDEARPVTELRKSVPPNVAAATAKALEKLPADRFSSAPPFAQALTGAGAMGSGTLTFDRSAVPRRRDVARGALWGALVTAGVAFLTSLIFWPGGEDTGADVRRTSIILPDSAPMAFVGQATQGVGRISLAISPDASTIVYVAQLDTTTQLYRRRLEESTVQPIVGTEGAYQVFFSPDGKQVGFFAGTELKTVSVDGGPVVTLGPQGEPAMGASWAEDGRIVISAREGTTLLLVQASGGDVDSITGLARSLSFPKVLPGGRWALGTANYRMVAMVSLETGDLFAVTFDSLVPLGRSQIPSGALLGNDPRYLASGHLTYVRADGVLMAVPFDPKHGRALGEPAPVLTSVRRETPSGVGQLAVAHDGTMVFAAGVNAGMGHLVWVDREGLVDTVPIPPQLYGQVTLSPDGTRIAAVIHPPTVMTEVWVFDLSRDTRRRVTAPPGMDGVYWWPDGSTLVTSDLSLTVRQRLSAERPFDTLSIGGFASDVTSDSVWFVTCCHELHPGLRLKRLVGGDSIVVDEHASAWGGTFSRDGRWVAWTSARSGRYEVWATSLEPGSEPQQISEGGGAEPRFSPRGDELVYMDGRRLFAVDVPSTANGRFGGARLVYEGPKIDVLERGHDISADGERILLVLGPPDDTVGHLTVVTNWFTELRRLAPERAR